MQYDITAQEIQGLPDGIYRVAVVVHETGEVVSEHTVRVEEVYVTSLGWEPAMILDLIRTSFAFLLEREAPQEILKEFNLRLIVQHFPEYEAAMKKWLVR